MIFRRTFFIAALFFGTFFFYSLPAEAFIIQPLRYQVTIDPGASAAVRVIVLNDETAAHRFRASVASVGQDDKGRPLFGVSSDIAEEWVKPSTNDFFLNPGGKKTITFNIHVPSKADPGSRFLALVIEPSDIKNGEVGLSARSAALLSLTISGVVNEAVTIDRFQPFKRFSLSGTWPLVASLKNRGTVSVKLDGTLIVKNALGQIVAGQPVFFGNNLLPKSIRAVAPQIELDRAQAHLPGRYTIDLVIHYGLSKSIIERQVVIWYFPPWSIVLIAGCLFGTGFLLVNRRRHSKVKL